MAKIAPDPLIRIDRSSLKQDLQALQIALPLAKEVIRRRNHPFFNYEPDSDPARDQLGFHQSRALTRLIFGGNQSGKSFVGGHEISWWLTESHPFQPVPAGAKIFVISANYRTIQEGLWRHLDAILPEWMIAKKGPNVPGWDIPSYVLMINGARVDFISGQGIEEARRKVQAAAIDLAAVDEEIDGAIYKELIVRRLSRGGRLMVLATLVRSEPWCCELEERVQEHDPTVALFRFDTYRALECGHVKKEIVEEMERSLSEEERNVRLHGLSLSREGLIYKSFGSQHICSPFPIPKNWTRYMSMDPGWRICAVLWAAVAPDGKYVIYRELYYRGANWKDIADAIYAAEGRRLDKSTGVWLPTDRSEEIRVRWSDPSAFGHHEGGQMRIGHLLAQHPWNLHFVPAQNDVLSGIEACGRSLGEDFDGVPRMRVFDTCTGFLKEVRRYRWQRDSDNTNKSEARDAPIKRNDHAMDGWRYLELNGLEYHEPIDPMLLQAEEPAPLLVKCASSIDELRQELRLKLYMKQKESHQERHPGGLGSEF